MVELEELVSVGVEVVVVEAVVVLEVDLVREVGLEQGEELVVELEELVPVEVEEVVVEVEVVVLEVVPAMEAALELGEE